MPTLARLPSAPLYPRAWKLYSLRDHLYLSIWFVSLFALIPSLPFCSLRVSFARTLLSPSTYSTLSAFLILLVLTASASRRLAKPLHLLVAVACIVGALLYASAASCRGARWLGALAAAGVVPTSFILFGARHHKLVRPAVEAEGSLALLILCTCGIYCAVDVFARKGRAKDAVLLAASVTCVAIATMAAVLAAADADEAQEAQERTGERAPLLEEGRGSCVA